MFKNPWMLLCVLLLFGCDTDRVYENFLTLPAYWHQDDAKSFEFEIEDSSTPYTLVAQFKQDIDYPNYNFYFTYSLKDDGDSVLQEKLEEVIFFEPKTGKPLGSGIGDTFDHELVLEDNFSFPGPGTYEIGFRQFMRVDSIPNILRVGLRIDRTVSN